MTKNKCPICTQVKGKRSCLLNNNALICSQCCAQTRSPKCEVCEYYKESQQFAIEKAKKSSTRFIARLDPEVDEEINNALIMIESGNISGGERVLYSIAKENPDLHTIHFALGTLYGLKKQYDLAMASFDKSLKIYPYFVDCWFNRAIAAKNALDFVEMTFSLQKVIELGDPSDSVVLQAKELLNNLAQGYFKESGLKLDAYMESMKAFEKAFAFMRDKEWLKAIASFNRAITINPRNAPTYGNLGICYMNLGENEKSLECYNKALEINPNYGPALTNREILKKCMKENISLDRVKMKEINYAKDSYEKRRGSK